MLRLALDQVLKKPGRIMTWHAGSRNRSHKSSNREDYITVVPAEMAPFLHHISSTTTVFDFLEQFLDDLIEEKLYGDEADPEDSLPPVLFELRGYFVKFLEFSVREISTPARRLSWEDRLRVAPPRWLILANRNVRSSERCYVDFEHLLDVSERVAERHALKLDLEMAKDGFRSMLRRREQALGRPPDWSLLDSVPFR